ncbi:MAG: nucleotidyl transferase AbiEii/AbiGii toxin family protein, partial [Thermodesulfobacteriota bacterium]
MKKVATLNQEQLRELFGETASSKGTIPAAIEKDFWICWTLMMLFEHDDLKKLFRFKGGTTLSKCFHVIDRFSEDIDLVLDWSVLTNEDPYEERTNTQQDRFNKRLNKLAAEYIATDLLPILNDIMQPPCVAEVDSSDEQIVNLKYPNVFSHEYLRPGIRLEIGPMGSMVPCSEYTIKAYAAENFPELFENSVVNVVSIVPERTFWEKVTILHDEAHR